jgi:nucleoredoxin
LAEFYLSAKELEEDGLEIIFVSSDRDEDSFKEYYGSQPWTSLPFEDKEHKQALAQKFGVSGIPMLVILDAAGNLKDASGRNTVSASRGNVSDCFSKWHN